MINTIIITNKQEMTNIETRVLEMIVGARIKLDIELVEYDKFIAKCEILVDEELKEQYPNSRSIIENILDYLSDEGVIIT